jgi:hypothetical protein
MFAIFNASYVNVILNQFHYCAMSWYPVFISVFTLHYYIEMLPEKLKLFYKQK